MENNFLIKGNVLTAANIKEFLSGGNISINDRAIKLIAREEDEDFIKIHLLSNKSKISFGTTVRDFSDSVFIISKSKKEIYMNEKALRKLYTINNSIKFKSEFMGYQIKSKINVFNEIKNIYSSLIIDGLEKSFYSSFNNYIEQTYLKDSLEALIENKVYINDNRVNFIDKFSDLIKVFKLNNVFDEKITEDELSTYISFELFDLFLKDRERLNVIIRKEIDDFFKFDLRNLDSPCVEMSSNCKLSFGWNIIEYNFFIQKYKFILSNVSYLKQVLSKESDARLRAIYKSFKQNRCSTVKIDDKVYETVFVILDDKIGLKQKGANPIILLDDINKIVYRNKIIFE